MNGVLYPSIEVIVDGKPLNSEIMVYSAVIDLTAETEESGTVFLETGSELNPLGNADAQRLLSAFPLMGKLEIKIGYDGKNESLFDGYIFERNLSYDRVEARGLNVICLDTKAVLRMNRAYVSHSVKSYDELLNIIGAKYNLRPVTDSLPKYESLVAFNQNGLSDFDFIANLARQLGREFFVLKRDMYFRSIANASGNPVTVKGENIFYMDYRTSVTGSFSEVSVAVHNQDTNKTGKYTCAAPPKKVGRGTTGSELIKKAGFDFAFNESLFASGKNLPEPRDVAEARMMSNSVALARLDWGMPGTAELSPGGTAVLGDAAEGIDNTYYLKRVRHIYKKGGRLQAGSYITEIQGFSNTVTV